LGFGFCTGPRMIGCTTGMRGTPVMRASGGDGGGTKIGSADGGGRFAGSGGGAGAMAGATSRPLAGCTPKDCAMKVLAATVPSAPQTGRRLLSASAPFTGSTSKGEFLPQAH